MMEPSWQRVPNVLEMAGAANVLAKAEIITMCGNTNPKQQNSNKLTQDSYGAGKLLGNR